MKDKLLGNLNRIEEKLIKLNDDIWEFSETRFEEFKSATAIVELLKEEEFQIEENVANMETAFIGTYGSGYPVIGILAEYDALSSLSQVSGSLEREPIEEGKSGHGCGHNIFGAASVGAAIVVKDYLKEMGIGGTIKVFGCPGEEGGSGKAFMAREGIFDSVDAALAWHPATVNAIMSASMLANYQVYFKFKGVTSHAAASPHLGRSALDAVELMNVGVNYLREHIVQEARVHYAVTNTGGVSPNVVQGNAEVVYLIRAPKLNQVDDIYKRIIKIAKGASMMTETEVEVVFDKGCSNVVPNRTLEKIMYENMLSSGGQEFSEEEYDFADKIRETLSEQERQNDAFLNMALAGGKVSELVSRINQKSICEEILPYTPVNITMPGSSDVGDVSWNTPTVQCAISCFALGTPAHSWQMVSQGNTSIAHKGMLKAAEVIGKTTIDLFNDHSIIEEAKIELKSELGVNGYKCPIPEGVMPSVIK